MPFDMRRNYSADLLRIFAFVLVFLFHSRREVFQFGYLGVEIFIFLSGFLMGSLKYKSGLELLKRRYVNLMMPFVLVSIVMLLFMQVFTFPNVTKIASSQILLTPFGLGHIFVSDQVGYFGSEAVLVPTLHLWSLSQEVAFYLIASILINRKIFEKILIILVAALILFATDILLGDYYFNILSRFIFFTTGFLFAGRQVTQLKFYTFVILSMAALLSFGIITLKQVILLIILLALCQYTLINDKLYFLPQFLKNILEKVSKRIYVYYLIHYFFYTLCATVLLNSYFNNFEIIIILIATVIFGEIIFQGAKSTTLPCTSKSLIIGVILVCAVNLYDGQKWRIKNYEKLEAVENNGVAVLKKVTELGVASGPCVKTFIGDSHARHLYFLYHRAGVPVKFYKASLEKMDDLLLKIKKLCDPNIAFRWSTEDGVLLEDLNYSLRSMSKPYKLWEEFPSFHIDPRKCFISNN